MGSKPSHALPANRPESGGTIKDRTIEKSGLLEREKQEFAAAQQAKQDGDEHGPRNTENQPSETGKVNE
jgi:hypothetical protein